jgi:hypothetical protein
VLETQYVSWIAVLDRLVSRYTGYKAELLRLDDLDHQNLVHNRSESQHNHSTILNRRSSKTLAVITLRFNAIILFYYYSRVELSIWDIICAPRPNHQKAVKITTRLHPSKTTRVLSLRLAYLHDMFASLRPEARRGASCHSQALCEHSHTEQLKQGLFRRSPSLRLSLH